MSSHPDDLVQTLAHHDAAINTLGGRMTGVERGMATLQTEVHTGFNALNSTLNGFNSKIDSIGSRPQLDIHRTVSTVTTLAVLFSMVVAGIIWITTSQFSGIVAEQRGFNAATTKQIESIDKKIEWLGRVDVDSKGKH